MRGGLYEQQQTPSKVNSCNVHSSIESKQLNAKHSPRKESPYDSPAGIGSPALRIEEASQYGSKVELQNLEIDIQVKVI